MNRTRDAQATHKRRTSDAEEALQRATCDTLRRLGWLAWHTPNERKASVQELRRLKEKGVLAGVVDWIISEEWERDGQTGTMLAIELKAQGNTTTPEQDRFLEQVQRRGWLTAVCYSMEEFVAVLRHVRPRNGRTLA